MTCFYWATWHTLSWYWLPRLLLMASSVLASCCKTMPSSTLRARLCLRAPPSPFFWICSLLHHMLVCHHITGHMPCSRHEQAHGGSGKLIAPMSCGNVLHCLPEEKRGRLPAGVLWQETTCCCQHSLAVRSVACGFCPWQLP